MARKTRIQYLGKEVDATSLDFKTLSENWNEYEVEDGSRLRVKSVATEVLRVDGSFDADNNPTYLLKAGNVLTVVVPDNLRRRE